MFGMVAKAVLCAGLIKIKSNLENMVQEEDKHRPMDYYATHRPAFQNTVQVVIATHLLPCHSESRGEWKLGVDTERRGGGRGTVFGK